MRNNGNASFLFTSISGIVLIFLLALCMATDAKAAEPDYALILDSENAVVQYELDIPAYGADGDEDALFYIPAGTPLTVIEITDIRVLVETRVGTAIARVWIDRDPVKTLLGTPVCMSASETLVYSGTGADSAVVLIPGGTPYFIYDEVDGMLRVCVPFGADCIRGYIVK